MFKLVKVWTLNSQTSLPSIKKIIYVHWAHVESILRTFWSFRFASDGQTRLKCWHQVALTFPLTLCREFCSTIAPKSLRLSLHETWNHLRTALSLVVRSPYASLMFAVVWAALLPSLNSCKKSNRKSSFFILKMHGFIAYEMSY